MRARAGIPNADRHPNRRVLEAARKPAVRASTFRPNSPIEAHVAYVARSRDALLRHMGTMHNWSPQVTPAACLTDRELRRYHDRFLHRFDPS